MAIAATTSSNAPAPIAAPQRQQEAKVVIDKPLEKSVAPPPPAAPPVPTVNTSGQTIGRLINTAA